MGFFQAIYSRLFKRSSSDSAAIVGTAATSAPRIDSYVDLISVGSSNTALALATVYRCVRLLSESVANLPMQYMVKRGDIFKEDTESHLHYLLTVQPTPTMSAFDFWVQAVENVLLEGNAYIVPIVNPATMEVDRLVLCARHTVSHDIYNDTYTICDTINGVQGVYSEDEIIHLRGLSLDGKSGLSVLTFARRTLDIGGTGDTETLNRFRYGGTVTGIIGNDRSVTGFGEYQDSQLEKTATDIDGQFRGGKRIVSLPGQVDFKQLSLSSTDMQFLETRKFTVREICRFFGVHPSFVFDDTSNNYKSAEMANVAFLSNTLNPILRKIENEFHRKLIPASLCCKMKFQFDRRGLYACDLDSKVKYQIQTIQAGLYTVNDWRKEENRPAVDGGDRVLVSTNLQDLSNLKVSASSPSEPSEPTEDPTEPSIPVDSTETTTDPQQ